MGEQMDWFDEEGKQEEKIDVGAFEALCKQLVSQREVYEEADRVAKEESKKLEQLKHKVLSYMRHYGKEKHHVPGFGVIYTKDIFSVTMPKDPNSKHEFFEWLRQKGVFENMVTVHSQTLNAMYKAEMDAAKAEGRTDLKIPGLAEPSHTTVLSMKRGS